jgi:hypothetical protein
MDRVKRTQMLAGIALAGALLVQCSGETAGGPGPSDGPTGGPAVLSSVSLSEGQAQMLWEAACAVRGS